MLQFYFLSILLNVIAGLILVYATDFTSKNTVFPENEKNDFENPSDSIEDSDKNTESDDSVFDKKLSFAINSKGTFFDDMTFRLVIAILSGLVGILKLLSTIQNDVPVIGDLIPAIAGLAACFALLVEYYIQKSTTEVKLPSVLNTVFINGRKYLGIFCIIAGVLHFIFPRVLFL